jgi:hypothetical protein
MANIIQQNSGRSDQITGASRGERESMAVAKLQKVYRQQESPSRPPVSL